MTLLSIVQDHCRVYALNIPTSVIGSQDTSVAQLLGLLNNLVENLIDENNWQAFTQEALWTMIPGEDQGTFTTDILPDTGFLWAANGTFWDRTLRRPLYGPVTDVEWQALKAIPNPGPWYKYRIRGDHFLINPAPTVGNLSEISFEYATSFAVKSSDGVLRPVFQADTDTSILPEKILKQGLAYRWKELKGLPYQPEMDRYYNMLNNYIARDGTKRVYRLDGANNWDVRPGIFVPSGNWPVNN